MMRCRRHASGWLQSRNVYWAPSRQASNRTRSWCRDLNTMQCPHHKKWRDVRTQRSVSYYSSRSFDFSATPHKKHENSSGRSYCMQRSFLSYIPRGHHIFYWKKQEKRIQNSSWAIYYYTSICIQPCNPSRTYVVKTDQLSPPRSLQPPHRSYSFLQKYMRPSSSKSSCHPPLPLHNATGRKIANQTFASKTAQTHHDCMMETRKNGHLQGDPKYQNHTRNCWTTTVTFIDASQTRRHFLKRPRGLLT